MYAYLETQPGYTQPGWNFGVVSGEVAWQDGTSLTSTPHDTHQYFLFNGEGQLAKVHKGAPGALASDIEELMP